MSELLRVGDLRVAESERWFLLTDGKTLVRRFSRRAWTRREVLAWREGYVAGRNHLLLLRAASGDPDVRGNDEFGL